MPAQPTSLKIGALDYTIRWYDQVEEDREERYGYCDNNLLVIGVSDRLSPAKKRDTFMHEVIHALWYVYDMETKEPEESAATKLGMGITMVARDNPAAFEWWLSGLMPEIAGKKKKTP